MQLWGQLDKARLMVEYWIEKESYSESWRTQTILVVLVSICIDFMDMVNDDVEN